MSVRLPMTVLVVLVAGCVRHYEVDDPGEACFEVPDAGAPLDVRVGVYCVSGSNVDEEWTCAVNRMSPNTIEISATYSYERHGNYVTLDCNNSSTTCASEPLAAGTWTAKYGLNEATFVVGDIEPTWICMNADEYTPSIAELAVDP